MKFTTRTEEVTLILPVELDKAYLLKDLIHGFVVSSASNLKFKVEELDSYGIVPTSISGQGVSVELGKPCTPETGFPLGEGDMRFNNDCGDIFVCSTSGKIGVSFYLKKYNVQSRS